MTPHNRSKGRLTFPARADHVLQRIRIITRELQNLQAEIYGRVSEGDPAGSPGLVDDAMSARVLAEFRAMLDQLRNLLWLCTEAGEGGAKTRGQQRDRQLAQATALLRALAPLGAGTSSSSPGSSSSSSSMRESNAPGPISFFDRLDRVIDNYVEGGGTLVEPKPRRRPKT